MGILQIGKQVSYVMTALILAQSSAYASSPLNLAPSRFAIEQTQTASPVKPAKQQNKARKTKPPSKILWNVVGLPQRRPADIVQMANLTSQEEVTSGIKNDSPITTDVAMEIHNAISTQLGNTVHTAEHQVDKIVETDINDAPRVIEGISAPIIISNPVIEAEEIALETITMAPSDPIQSEDDQVRTILADPLQRHEDKEILGSIFADERLSGGVFDIPEHIKPSVIKSLQNARFTTASISNSSNATTDKSIPELVESVIFGSQRLTTASITTGSITPVQDIKIQQFAQNSAENLSALDIQLLLNEGGPLVQQDAIWRIFSDTADALGEPVLLHRVEAPALDISLPYGTYIIHASYGLASIHKTIILARDEFVDNFILNAGGLKVTINHAAKEGFRAEAATFSVYPIADLTSLVENQEPAPIATDLPNGGIVRLNTGTYRIVSRYGDANSVIEAEARVEAGKLVEAEIIHQSGEVTLKLTRQFGGSALANTQWTILGASGDLISESVGALSKHTLAVGDYTVIAANGGETYDKEFSVTLGENPVVEVLAQ